MNLRAESISLRSARELSQINSVVHRLGTVSGRETQPIDLFSRGNGGLDVAFRWFLSLGGTCDPWLSIIIGISIGLGVSVFFASTLGLAQYVWPVTPMDSTFLADVAKEPRPPS